MALYKEIKIVEQTDKVIKSTITVSCRRSNRPGKRFTVMHKKGLNILSVIGRMSKEEARREIKRCVAYVEEMASF